MLGLVNFPTQIFIPLIVFLSLFIASEILVFFSKPEEVLYYLVTLLIRDVPLSKV